MDVTFTKQSPKSARVSTGNTTRTVLSIGFQRNVPCQRKTAILESSLTRTGLDSMGRVPRIRFVCDNPDCPLPFRAFTENITGALRRKKNHFNYCSNRCKYADQSRTTNERIKSSEKRN